MDTPDTLVHRLVACGVSLLDIRGCSDADIAHVAAVAGGPWTDIASAISPYRAPMTGGNRFFRVIKR